MQLVASTSLLSPPSRDYSHPPRLYLGLQQDGEVTRVDHDLARDGEALAARRAQQDLGLKESRVMGEGCEEVASDQLVKPSHVTWELLNVNGGEQIW